MLNPYFEVNNKKYEIKRTRYLLAEYDKLTNDNNLTADEKANSLKAQTLLQETQKLGAKLQEVEKIYFETFSDEDEIKYNKIKKLYDESLNKLIEFESQTNGSNAIQKEAINILERITILGLAEQYKMSESDAEEIWCSYVDKVGRTTAIEWLSGMSECLLTNEEEEVPFLEQLKKKREEQQKKRKGGLEIIK